MTVSTSHSMPTSGDSHSAGEIALKLVSIVALLYLFILSITLLGSSFKLFGEKFAESIFQATSNPITGLVIGILVTAIIQSSSTTTSLIVGLVGVGTISFENAIPMVMGANIGTTITNLIVSLASIGRRDEFRRAFHGSILHDFFNLCSVAVLLPLQIKYNIIGASAMWLQRTVADFGGLKFSSPLKAATKPVASWILHITGDSGWIGAAIALILLFVALKYIVTVLKSMVLARVERFFSMYIFRTAALSFALGAILTALVQSSSITSSIVIPLIGAGVISIDQIFPYLLGTNIGTTVTAFLASFVTGSSDAVAVAFAHLLFNVYGILIFWPLKFIPMKLAETLANLTVKSKLVPILFIVTVYFVVPGLILWLMR